MIDEKDLRSMVDYAFHFGEIAIRKGFITELQLEYALDTQIKHNLINDNHKLIGEILLQKRWMTEEQITTVLEEIVKNKNMLLQLSKIQF